MAKTARQNMLAKVHLAKKDLGLSDADYRHVLEINFRASSAGHLSDRQLGELLDHFKSKGWQAKTKGRPAESKRDVKPPVPEDRQQLIDKIEALLAEKGRLEGRRISWAYARAILRKQGGPQYLNWATSDQLIKIIQALSYALKRARARQAEGAEVKL